MSVYVSSGAHGSQRHWMSQSSIDGCRHQCGSWGLNKGPLREQHIFFTAGPSLQPRAKSCYDWLIPLSTLSSGVKAFAAGVCGGVRWGALCSML